MAQRDFGEKFSWGAGTHGGVVARLAHMLQEFMIMAGDPTDTQTAKSHGLLISLRQTAFLVTSMIEGAGSPSREMIQEILIVYISHSGMGPAISVSHFV